MKRWQPEGPHPRLGALDLLANYPHNPIEPTDHAAIVKLVFGGAALAVVAGAPRLRDQVDLVGIAARHSAIAGAAQAPLASVRLLEQAGATHITLKNLRHTHATLMLLNGEHPKVVSERLGHSRISTTLDVYSHVLPNLQAAAAARFDELLGTTQTEAGLEEGLEERGREALRVARAF